MSSGCQSQLRGVFARSLFALGAIAFLTSCGAAPQIVNEGLRSETADEGASSIDLSAETASSSDDAAPSSAEWLIRSSVNPLNDSVATSATRIFAVGAFTVELEVICDQIDELSYRATTFGADGDGAPLNWTYDSSELRTSIKGRVDSEDAGTWSSEPRRFSNQFTLVGPALQFARANALTIGFGLSNGDVLMTIDQTDQPFRDTVQPCLDEYPRQNAVRSRPPTEQGTYSSQPVAPPDPVADNAAMPPDGER